MAKQKTLFEQTKIWWKTDTAKAVATVMAVLLIPVSVVAWNYVSGKDITIDDKAASTQISEENNGEKEILDKSSGGANSAEQGSADDDEKSKPAIGGIEEITTLPDTSSKE